MSARTPEQKRQNTIKSRELLLRKLEDPEYAQKYRAHCAAQMRARRAKESPEQKDLRNSKKRAITPEQKQKRKGWLKTWRERKKAEDPEYFRDAQRKLKLNADYVRRDAARRRELYAQRVATDPEFRKRRAEATRKYGLKRKGDPVYIKKASDRDKKLRSCAESWGRANFRNIQRRAKQKGVPFNIDLSDLIIPKICPIRKTPFVFGKVCHPDLPSVDRIVPEFGYIKGNVRIISFRANSIKRDATLKEIKDIAADMEMQLPMA